MNIFGTTLSRRRAAGDRRRGQQLRGGPRKISAIGTFEHGRGEFRFMVCSFYGDLRPGDRPCEGKTPLRGPPKPISPRIRVIGSHRCPPFARPRANCRYRPVAALAHRQRQCPAVPHRSHIPRATRRLAFGRGTRSFRLAREASHRQDNQSAYVVVD